MRILMVQQNLPPYKIIGPLIHAYLLATRLAKMGHEVHVLLERTNYGKEAGRFGHYPWDGLIVHRYVPVTSAFDMFPYVMLSGYYIKELEKTYNFDIIHAHTAYAGFLAYYKPKAPTIITVHGVYAQFLNAIKEDLSYVNENFLKKLRMLIGAKLYSHLERVACKRSDGIIAITPKEKRLIIERYRVNDPRKIFVIPNGVDIHESERIANEYSDKVNLDFERPIVLFVGRLTYVKGLPQLLKAWRMLKSRGVNGTLVIAGKVESNSIAEYVHDFSSDVKVIQNVPRGELLALYSKADIFVLPSLFEGLPYTLLDALSLGKPALVSSRLCFEGLLGDSALYGDPLHLMDFAGKMQMLMENEQLRFELGRRARHLAQTHFSLSSIMKETERVYEAMISQRK
jgi:glycosyltransferase involved in cell wall biosynthesis